MYLLVTSRYISSDRVARRLLVLMLMVIGRRIAADAGKLESLSDPNWLMLFVIAGCLQRRTSYICLCVLTSSVSASAVVVHTSIVGLLMCKRVSFSSLLDVNAFASSFVVIVYETSVIAIFVYPIVVSSSYLLRFV